MKFRTKSGSTYEVESHALLSDPPQERHRVRMLVEGNTRGGKHKRPIGAEWVDCTSVSVVIGRPAVIHRANNNKPVVTNDVEETW